MVEMAVGFIIGALVGGAAVLAGRAGPEKVVRTVAKAVRPGRVADLSPVEEPEPVQRRGWGLKVKAGAHDSSE